MDSVTYASFANRYGDAHIATPLSVAAVKKLAQRSRHILEIGAGVGTLTFTALSASPQATVEVYEDNKYCGTELRKNLAQFEGRYILQTDLRSLPLRKEYDLIIVDGGSNFGDCGYPEMTEDIFKHIEPSLIYFEGVRRAQRKIVRKLLRDKSMWVSIKRIPFQYCSGTFYKGGTIMKCKKNVSRLRCWRTYILNEIREARFLEVFFGRIEPPF